MLKENLQNAGNSVQSGKKLRPLSKLESHLNKTIMGEFLGFGAYGKLRVELKFSQALIAIYDINKVVLNIDGLSMMIGIGPLVTTMGIVLTYYQNIYS